MKRMGVTAFYFHSSSNKCITTLKDFLFCFVFMTFGLKDYADKGSQRWFLCLRCNGPTLTCSYSWERCDTQQRFSITETSPREQLTWLGNKESAICYVYGETSWSSSLLRPALSIDILFLQMNYMNLTFDTVSNGPEMKSLSWASSSSVPKATDLPWASTVMDTVLGWKNSPHIW